MRGLPTFAVCLVFLSGPWCRVARAQGPAAGVPSRGGAFYPAALRENARANVAKYPWAAAVRDQLVRAAEPWLGFSDEQLWELVFGSTLERSWMVWSAGHCPACDKGVPMYNWQIDALHRPWKLRCPHCRELFPKNDFGKFYRSGIDEHGVFDPGRADRELLFNAGHPDPADPLHPFGVDDGSGYAEGQRRWRFIGTYLIYGQWKQLIVGGITRLAAAHAVTGDPVYAHKAGVLLDRVADLYPTFDFGKQGIVYEHRGASGYVSTWHDACVEVCQIALAYDQVAGALQDDAQLVAFLAGKARQHGLDNPKASFRDVRRNIEDRILRDTLNHRPKISSNYPQTDVTIAVIKTVLDWPDNREEVHGLIDAIVQRATAVDGVTGEKGLAGYAAIGPRLLGSFLERFARMDPAFLPELLKRHPQLQQTYRFHVDTWCLGRQYYPLSGDTGHFAAKCEHYAGLSFARSGSLEPSAFTFLWRLYELTSDPALVQVLYHANGDSLEGLPYDLLADDPAAFQAAVGNVIAREGKDLELSSTNKQQWHLAVLRSGRGEAARAVWLDYDSRYNHGHQDGMNLGLLAKGLDLMPDFGYPPVQYGGWRGPKFTWYLLPSAHNTVVVDGKGQPTTGGKTTLWADGHHFRAIRVSAPAIIAGEQFERTVAMVDLSDRDFYVLDVFRVVGGTDHAKFVHSHFGRIDTKGLNLEPAPEYGHGALMRNFRTDPAARPGWSADWTIEDRHQYLPPGREVHLRYTDLTDGVEASTAEGWIVAGIYDSMEEAWIPRLMVRRRGEPAPLASTFVSVLEPYEGTSHVARVLRLPLETEAAKRYPEFHVAVEVQAADGRRDLLVALDVENPLGKGPAPAKDAVAVQRDRQLRLDGELGLVRWNAAGNVERIVLCRGRALRVGNVAVTLKEVSDSIEIRIGKQQVSVLAGDPQVIEAIEIDGRPAHSSSGGTLP